MAAVAVAAMAGAALVAVPHAHAEGGLGSSLVIAAQSDTGELLINNPVDTSPDVLAAGFTVQHTGLGMYPGTRPAIAATNSGYVVAFEANTGHLWLGVHDLGLAMMPGTSPAIVIVRGGYYTIAFQGSDGNLWTTSNDPGAPLDWRLPMNPNSSPSITAEPQGGYEVAYESNTNELRLAGDQEMGTGLGMQPATSPAIAELASGGTEVAFQANTGGLWTTGSGGTWNTGLGMTPGTSPAITGVASSDKNAYEVAFEANTNQLWTAGTLGTGPRGMDMAPGTSPTITGMNHGTYCAGAPYTPNGYAVSFQAPNHLLRYEEVIFDLFGSPNPAFDTGYVTATNGTQVPTFTGSSPSMTAFGLHQDASCDPVIPPSTPCKTFSCL